MSWKWHSANEIVEKLAEIRLSMQAGACLRDAIKAKGISEATYFRWRAQFGNLDTSQVSLLKQLAAENSRLRRALAELDGPVTA